MWKNSPIGNRDAYWRQRAYNREMLSADFALFYDRAVIFRAEFDVFVAMFFCSALLTGKKNFAIATYRCMILYWGHCGLHFVRNLFPYMFFNFPAFPFGKSFIYIWFPYYNKRIQVSFITEMNYAYNIANVITTAIKVAYCNGKQFKLDLVNVHLRNTKNPEDYFTFHSHLDSREKLFFIDFTSRCKSQLDGFFL